MKRNDSPKTPRIIMWEHWTNPLGGGKEYTDDWKEEGEDDVLWSPDDHPPEPKATAVRPVIPTAGGLMPLQVYGQFSCNYNFWMMHTTFSLGKKTVAKLESLPGVETLDVVDRYRARVGFGKCFKSAEVKARIYKELRATSGKEGGETPPAGTGTGGEITLDAETQRRLAAVREGVQDKFKFWALYVIPNGEVVLGYADKGEQYDTILDLLKQSRDLAGGIILTSNDAKL